MRSAQSMIAPFAKTIVTQDGAMGRSARSETPARPKKSAPIIRRRPDSAGIVREIAKHPASITITVAAYPHIRYGRYMGQTSVFHSEGELKVREGPPGRGSGVRRPIAGYVPTMLTQ